MKINQTIDSLCCDDALKSIFDLNTLDVEIFKKLRDLGESRADEIAISVGKERSTAYRSLQKLTSCGLCLKNAKNLDGGGYFHTYCCVDTKIAKNKLKSCLNNWYKSMRSLIENLDIE